jgi:hypothetical protein
MSLYTGIWTYYKPQRYIEHHRWMILGEGHRGGYYDKNGKKTGECGRNMRTRLDAQHSGMVEVSAIGVFPEERKTILTHKVKDGVYEVSGEGQTFFVSIMKDKFNCLRGIAPFRQGQNRPKRGKHILLTPEKRVWLESLILIREVPYN